MKNIIHVTLFFVLFGLNISASLAKEVTTCQCYDTKPIKIVDFLENDKIVALKSTSCKKGYVLTGFVQKPETDPQTNGQYIYHEQATCCRLCLE